MSERCNRKLNIYTVETLLLKPQRQCGLELRLTSQHHFRCDKSKLQFLPTIWFVNGCNVMRLHGPITITKIIHHLQLPFKLHCWMKCSAELINIFIGCIDALFWAFTLMDYFSFLDSIFWAWINGLLLCNFSSFWSPESINRPEMEEEKDREIAYHSLASELVLMSLSGWWILAQIKILIKYQLDLFFVWFESSPVVFPPSRLRMKTREISERLAHRHW